MSCLLTYVLWPPLPHWRLSIAWGYPWQVCPELARLWWDQSIHSVSENVLDLSPICLLLPAGSWHDVSRSEVDTSIILVGSSIHLSMYQSINHAINQSTKLPHIPEVFFGQSESASWLFWTMHSLRRSWFHVGLIDGWYVWSRCLPIVWLDRIYPRDEGWETGVIDDDDDDDACSEGSQRLLSRLCYWAMTMPS